MTGVRNHYENHLAKYYAWIFGDTEAKIEENRKFFIDHNIHPTRSGLAFDLGAGSGFQSIPLAELGFRVIAMDLSPKMLTQLKENAKKLPIEEICDDLSNFTAYDRGHIELVVCMGDTLTHLKSLKNVRTLLDNVYSVLTTGGRLILSFRNLAHEFEELDRFIPVRSDDKTIFTCFLEYEEKTVKVHDIIYQKKDNQWTLKKSFFRKLRISPDWVQNYLQQVEFTIEFSDEKNGMITFIARKE
jgi:SAM-dependent methyltransferase